MKTIPQDKVLFGGYTTNRLEIQCQMDLIKSSEQAIKSYWNLPSDYKGEFPFNCTEFNTNKHYETIKRAKAKLILLGQSI